MIDWEKVREALKTAKGAAFDGCHKIYALMDEGQVFQMSRYDYGVDSGTRLVDFTPEWSEAERLALVRGWYDNSCTLRFIEAVATVPGNPSEGFTTLIEQGEGDDDDDDDYDYWDNDGE